MFHVTEHILKKEGEPARPTVRSSATNTAVHLYLLGVDQVSRGQGTRRESGQGDTDSTMPSQRLTSKQQAEKKSLLKVMKHRQSSQSALQAHRI